MREKSKGFCIHSAFAVGQKFFCFLKLGIPMSLYGSNWQYTIKKEVERLSKI